MEEIIRSLLQKNSAWWAKYYNIKTIDIVLVPWNQNVSELG